MRIYFCKNPSYSCCLLIEKLFSEGRKCIISSPNLSEIDDYIWTFKQHIFIPHYVQDNHVIVPNDKLGVKISIYKIVDEYDAAFLYKHELETNINLCREKMYQIFNQEGNNYVSL